MSNIRLLSFEKNLQIIKKETFGRDDETGYQNSYTEQQTPQRSLS